MNMIKNTVTLMLGLAICLLTSLAMAADQKIDPTWKTLKTTIDFVDPKGRLIVVGDREFKVPFNTPIYDVGDKPIALSNLRVGNPIWVYLDSSRANIKRINKLK